MLEVALITEEHLQRSRLRLKHARMTNPNNRAEQPSKFLTALPSEIRNDICERLLLHKRPIKITKGRSERHTRILLDVCRQLKDEFSALYYHGNIFTSICSSSDLDRELDSTSSLILWFRRIGPRNRSMLREVQMRIVNGRTQCKEDRFAFLRDQNVRISREVGWLPLSVLRVPLQHDWLTQLELSELILKEEKDEEVDALERTGSSLAKGPDLRLWKRETYDPVIDKYSKPNKRQLSEFVCPANWRYYAHSEAALSSDEGLVEVQEEEADEKGCLSGGFKILIAKMRKGRMVVSGIRRKRSIRGK